jgi:hypothetical protein
MTWGNPNSPQASEIAQGSIDQIHAAVRAQVTERDEEIAIYRRLLAGYFDRLTDNAYAGLTRSDPTVPGRWQARDWAEFLAQHNKIPGPTWGQTDLLNEVTVLRAENKQLREENQRLQQQVEIAALPVEQSVVVSKPVPTVVRSQRAKSSAKVFSNGSLITPKSAPVWAAVDRFSVVLDETRATLAALAPHVPAVPLAHTRQLAADAAAWCRQFLALYLMGQCGLSQEYLINYTLDLFQKGAQSILKGLVTAGLVIEDRWTVQINIDLPNSPSLWRLSASGAELHGLLFAHTEPIENEWARLIRLSEGSIEPRAASALLLVSQIAQLRGYQTQIVSISELVLKRRSEQMQLIILLDDGDYRQHWQAQSFVCFCAANSVQRQQWVADCRQLNLPGCATDLPELLKVWRPDAPLFVDEWS